MYYKLFHSLRWSCILLAISIDLFPCVKKIAWKFINYTQFFIEFSSVVAKLFSRAPITVFYFLFFLVLLQALPVFIESICTENYRAVKWVHSKNTEFSCNQPATQQSCYNADNEKSHFRQMFIASRPAYVRRQQYNK